MDRRTLAREVSEVLELPLDDHKGKDICYQIVNAFIDSISSALQRGERVSIPGFGIFEVKTRKPFLTKFGYSRAEMRFNNKNMVAKLTKPRKYVLFKPSKVLKRMLHDGDSNQPV